MLDLSIGVMLIEAGIFLITLFLLKQWLFNPLVKFMDEREERLRKSLEIASTNDEDVKKIEAEIEEILALARIEAKKIKEEAKERALKDAAEMKSKIEAEIEEAKERLSKELLEQKDAILNSLLSQKDEFKDLVEKKVKVA